MPGSSFLTKRIRTKKDKECMHLFIHSWHRTLSETSCVLGTGDTQRTRHPYFPRAPRLAGKAGIANEHLPSSVMSAMIEEAQGRVSTLGSLVW